MRQLVISQRITERDGGSINTYFSEIGKLNLINDSEEVELSCKIKQGDEKAIKKLVESNLRFVVSVAKQFQGQGIRLEDLINEGNYGLIKAAKKFDSERGFKFISYAVWWIRQCILQAIAEQSRTIRVPINKFSEINKVRKATINLEQKLEREPTDEELQQCLDDTNIKIKDIRQITGRVVSLDSPLKDEETFSLIDVTINEDSLSPDNSFIDEGFQEDLEKVLEKLTPRQKQIICMYFGLQVTAPMNLEEIGEHFDLTRERVRQIKDNALKFLKCRDNSKILRQHLKNG